MKRMTQLIATGIVFSLMMPAFADEPILADSGELYVHGVLRENTCRLEMDSAWQDIDLGDTTRADVNLVGKMTKPITVTLYLRDCPEIPTRSANITALTHTRSTQQPAYQARFVAVTDTMRPELIKVTGASGIGLRLKDSHGKTVKIDQPGDTVLLNPGQDSVSYTLQVERTNTPLIPGPYHALIQFSMMYQ
ncbi:type 1 fimbrial protein [Cronobacter universalis]|uniref:Fimbrial protein n=1 Tax=Cronobacter universalis NCTC 9529 TaxID=1074000 RepID=A0AAC9EWK9_9ENTR|nr:fimbrial protein [Cronobacter universalis]ALB56271.1 fimbrial protein [Cronobacter universalis NCTC 9529]ELY3759232.1 type 1 fimbrial protein [Cronobacter universalis]ELY6246039.1 type 1 fimbrial protein [Cronobacter universalis]STD15390.1 PAP fimbrial minor pilin protein precursor [Cronobacter universalis NCTC 9529]